MTKTAKTESEEKKVAAHIPRGKPKSGRLWKTVRKERHSTIKKVKSYRTSWSEKMEKKKEKEHFKQMKIQIKEEENREKQLRRQRAEENRKKKLENQRKSEIIQVIKDTAKIKKMKRKQLKSIETR